MNFVLIPASMISVLSLTPQGSSTNCIVPIEPTLATKTILPLLLALSVFPIIPVEPYNGTFPIPALSFPVVTVEDNSEIVLWAFAVLKILSAIPLIKVSNFSMILFWVAMCSSISLNNFEIFFCSSVLGRLVYKSIHSSIDIDFPSLIPYVTSRKESINLFDIK